MPNTKDTILIIVARYLCYASNEWFALSLAKALKDYGQSVEVCNIISKEDADLQLAKYVDKTYLAIIGFNSTLPRARVGKRFFLDCIDAPFFDYIVDHPLYHHPILSIPLQNFHVICIDQMHQEYIKKYYPQIKSTLFLPLAGSRALSQIPFSKKRAGILFTGTYYPPSRFRDAIASFSVHEQNLVLQMADLLIDSSLTLAPEEALAHISQIKDPLLFREQLNRYYNADIYARAVIRERCITQLAQTGLPMMLCGNEWEASPLAKLQNITIRPGVDYRQCIEMIASSQILLNILPGFLKGSHDRVFNAMANTTLLLSDTNDYLLKELHPGQDSLLFKHKKTADLAAILQDLLCNTDQMESIAQCGQQCYQKSHTWHHRASILLKHLSILSYKS